MNDPAMRFSEQQIVMECGDRNWLVGLAFVPDRPTARCLICNPLFEERKTAQRALTNLARKMAGRGLAALLFDYRGCGDSGGEFAEFAVADWLADLRTATRQLASLAPGCETVYCGLRFGATLAMLAAAANPEVKTCCLWAPVVSGKQYLFEELRRKIMKEMLTFGANRSTRDELVARLQAGETVDLDGYALAPRLFHDLCAVDLASGPEWHPETRFAIWEIGPGARLSRELKNLAGRLARCAAKDVRMQAFWNQVGLVDCTDLIDATVQWLTEGDNQPQVTHGE